MQLILNGLIAGSLSALVASGLALVYGVLGVFNLALGQLVLIGGYVTWWMHQVAHLPLVPSIFLGLVIGTLVTWLSFLIFVAPFYKRHRYLPLVTTIALSMMLDGSILLLFGESPKSILPGSMQSIIILGGRITAMQIMLVALTCGLLILLAFALHSTAFGRRLRAVVQNDHAALSLGIPAARLHQLLFIASGFLAACGGVVLGIDQNLTPTLAFTITIKAYAAIIAGGKGNLWGAILFAYIIAFLEQLIVGIHWFGAFYVPAGFQNTVALLLIIGFLLWRPTGLLASAQRTA